MSDLDQGGFAFQKVRTYLGPSLGWAELQVSPEQYITSGGVTTLGPGTSVVLVNFAGSVTVDLPDVQLWMREPQLQPITAFNRSIWIKDFGGVASTFPITIRPFAGQKVDNLDQDLTIDANGQLIQLYPLNDLSGWFYNAVGGIAMLQHYQIGTIDAGQSLSGSVDCSTGRLARIDMPAAWTTAVITFAISPDDVTYLPLYDASGTEYTVQATAGRSVLIPLVDFLGSQYIKVRSGTVGTPVNQSAERELGLTLVS